MTADTIKMSPTGITNAENALRDMQEIGAYHSLTLGVSMRPMLRQERDIVVIEPVRRPLKKNDVPLYRRENYDLLVLHRILEVREDCYVIRGDNTYKKEYVPKNYVLGVLTGFYRNKKKKVDCEKSIGYKLYVFMITHTYGLRYLWKIKVRPFLVRIVRKFIKRKPKETNHEKTGD